MNKTLKTATIEADAAVPIIRITRDVEATEAQLFRAHTDPELFATWVGPDGTTTTLDAWDARTGGGWRYVAARDGVEVAFHGCFPEVRPDRVVQTFTWGESAVGELAVGELAVGELAVGELAVGELAGTCEGAQA